MKTLNVGLEQNSYNILIDPGLLGKLGALIQPFIQPVESVAVVTDEDVWRHHGAAFGAAMNGIGYRPIIVPAGEIAAGLGNIRTMNVVLLGTLVRTLGLGTLAGVEWEDVLTDLIPGKLLEVNLAAFKAGLNG